MRILIDTHILIWSLVSPKKLKKKHMDILNSLDNDIFVSSVSLWEISLKFASGKLQIEGLKLDHLNEDIESIGFNFLDLNANEAITFYNLTKIQNNDPFDRMLVWQSIKNDCYFMSIDENILEYKKFGLKLV